MVLQLKSQYSNYKMNCDLNGLQLLSTVCLLLLHCQGAESEWITSQNHSTEQNQSVNTTEGLPKHCVGDTDCPLWTECLNSKCVCKKNLKKHSSIKCDRKTLKLSVRICNCVTIDEETAELFVGYCWETCIMVYKSKWLSLPLNVSKLNQLMCETNWNRTGKLCGKCLPGHSPLAYSYDMRCVECPEGNKNIWKYILIAFGPLTIFYFLILFLKINATSSYLHGYTIFSQIILAPDFARTVVAYSWSQPKLKLCVQIIGTLYIIWSLDFFRMLDLNICLNLPNIAVLALDYVVAIYPLLLTVVSYILIDLHGRNVKIVVILWKPFRYLFILLRRNWDSRTTVIDAYATFFVLSFTKLLYVSADLLIPVRTHSLNNDSVRWALYYDATVDYFGKEHLPYAILAITGLSLFITPTILFLLFYQLKCFQKLLNSLRIHSHLLKAVMDSFQGCYKDGTDAGTRDCRWFVAVPFIGQLIILTLHSILLVSTVLPFIIIAVVLIMILTSIVQPYKRQASKYTKTDIASWGVLVIVGALTETGTLFSSPNSLSTPGRNIGISKLVEAFVASLPLLCMICFSAYWILSRMRKMKRLLSGIKARMRGYMNVETDFEEMLPDRIVNPGKYQVKILKDPTCTI